MARKVKGLTEYRINCGIFQFDIIIALGPRENLPRYISWKYDDPELMFYDVSTQRGICFTRRGYTPVIWMPGPPRTPDQIGTFAHEAFHAVFDLANWARIPLGPDSEEFYAHAVGSIVREGLGRFG